MKITNLPTSPGVYIFRNKDKKVLYVGKAINLKNRVKSYLTNIDSLTPKTRSLVEKTSKIEHIKVDNELEALLLEAELIKRYYPPYNTNLKDDKFYKYISIESVQLKIPQRKAYKKVYKISTTRKEKEKRAGKEYFGPYPETTSIQIILRTLRKVFPYRDCSTSKFNRYKDAKRPCLYGHIGLCPAPCQSISGAEQNNQNIVKIKQYLKGNRKLFFKRLRKEMQKASKEQNYEKAAIIRDQLASYEYLTQPKRDIKEYIKTPNLVDDYRETSINTLLKLLREEGLMLKHTNSKNFRIETYDVSNIQGKKAVGSMVVLTGGIPDKKEYRRFKIKTKNTPDDFSMMGEILRRRFKRIKSKGKDSSQRWKLPDLIVVDGGKGQLSSALEILKENNTKIPAIGLAKRFEEIIIKVGQNFKIIHLPDNSPALNILKLGRDEAHRFAINYYRKLHRKNLIK